MYTNIYIFFLKKCTSIFLYLITFFQWWVFGTGVIVRGYLSRVYVRGVFVLIPVGHIGRLSSMHRLRIIAVFDSKGNVLEREKIIK